jgi:dihydroorotase
MTHFHIKDARVIDPANNTDERKDLFISNGVLTDKIAPSNAADTHTIEADNLIASPGFTDLYARLREPGFSRKGTIASESKAALHAGFTRVFCAPDTHPAIDSTATVELIKQKANSAGGSQVIPIGALTQGLAGEMLSEMATLYNAGCPIMSNGDKPISDTGVLLSAMQYAASFDIPILINPIDPAIAGEGCAHDGAMATQLGLPGIPVIAETVALTRLIEMSRSTGCRIHLSRLSAARSIDLVRQAKAEDLPITCDVGIHHLYFSDAQLSGFNVNYHSLVPFRSETDRDALRLGIKDGTVDAICSDHAPHDNDAKLAPFPSSGAGLSAFDVFLPLLIGLPKLLDMPIGDVIAKVTSGPAQVVYGLAESQVSSLHCPTGIDQTGLVPGSVADLVLIDLERSRDISAENFASAGLNSPLVGVDNLQACSGEATPIQGLVTHSFVAGSLILHLTT